jgi:hypothetical protein
MRYVTVTNRGYAAYVLNWLVSVRRVGISVKDCRVYCTDHEAAALLSYTGVDLELVPGNPGDFAREPGFWMNDDFRSMCWAKVVCQWKELQRGQPFVYSDVDLVFHANPSLYLNGVSGIDVAAQVSVEPAGRFRLCGGFLYLLPTENTQRLLRYTEADRDTFKNDEVLLNKRLDADMSIRWFALPADRFPDGSYGGTSEARDRYVTHFNHIKGTTAKWRKMVTLGQWFVDAVPEGCVK